MKPAITRLFELSLVYIASKIHSGPPCFGQRIAYKCILSVRVDYPESTELHQTSRLTRDPPLPGFGGTSSQLYDLYAG